MSCLLHFKGNLTDFVTHRDVPTTGMFPKGMFPKRDVPKGVPPIFPQNNIVLEVTVLKKLCKFQVRISATATRTRIVKIMNNVQMEIVFQHVLYCHVDVMPIV